MASPTFVAAGSSGFPGFGVNPGIPAGIANADILLLYVAGHYSTTPTVSGWTLKSNYNAGAGRAGSIFWKRTTGTESAPTVTIGAADDGSLSVICAYRGCVSTGDPFSIVGSWQDNASSTALTTSAITISHIETLVIHFAVLDLGAANTYTWTGAATSSAFGAGNDNGTFTSTGAAHLAKSGSGSSGTATLTTDSTQTSSSVLLALASIFDPTSNNTDSASVSDSQTAGASAGTGAAFDLSAFDNVAFYTDAAPTANSSDTASVGDSNAVTATFVVSSSDTASVADTNASRSDVTDSASVADDNTASVVGASPTFVAVGTTGFPGFGSNPGVPAGIANLDILVLYVGLHSATAPTTPSGYTLKSSHIDTVTGNRAGYIYWKRTTGTESAPTVAGVTDTGSLSMLAAYRGCASAGDPFDTVGTWQDQAAATVHTTPAITTLTGATLLSHFVIADGSADTWTWSGSAATSSFNAGNSNPVAQGIGAGHGARAGSGSTGTATLTTNLSPATSSVLFALGSTTQDANSANTDTAGIAETNNAFVFSGTVPVTDTTHVVDQGVGRYGGAPFIRPMTRITGRPTFGTNTPSLLQDGQFRASFAWSGVTTSWAAVNVGSGYTSLLVQVGNEDNSSGDLRPAWNSGSNSTFTAFRIQTSSDSTNGADGSWTTVVTETANPYIYREYKIAFTGKTFLKFIADASVTVDEIEIWDASSGATDTWLFIGDSITNRATKRGNQSGVGTQPSFQADISTLTGGTFPHQAGGGFVGQGAAFLDTHIGDLLTDFPDVVHWGISIGTNDANAGSGGIATWSGHVQNVIDAIKAAGRVPYLARIPYTTDASFGFPTNTNLYNTDATYGIDHLKTVNGLLGPDLYTYFQNHTSELEDGVHPNETGCRSWNILWANSILSDYQGGPFDITDTAGIADSSTVDSALGTSATDTVSVADSGNVATVTTGATDTASVSDSSTVAPTVDSSGSDVPSVSDSSLISTAAQFAGSDSARVADSVDISGSASLIPSLPSIRVVLGASRVRPVLGASLNRISLSTNGRTTAELH